MWPFGKKKKKEKEYGDMRDFITREYDEDGNEIELSKEDGDFGIYIEMLDMDNDELRQKGLSGMKSIAEKGHVVALVIMWSHSADDEERKKWDKIAGENGVIPEYTMEKLEYIESLKD